MAKEIMERKDIPEDYKWDLKPLFENVYAWEEEYKNIIKRAQDFLKYQGKFTKSSHSLLIAIKDLESI